MEDEKLNNALKDIAVLQKAQESSAECCRSVTAAVNDIKEKLLGRPSWFVLIVISSLSTLCTSLLIYIACRQ